MANKRGKADTPAARQTKPGGEPSFERLDPPLPAAQEQIRAHFAGHGIRRFQLDRHVYLGGPRKASQIISWDPGRASFHCERCPGRSFWTGEITGSLVERQLLFDQGLAPFLAGLTDPQERAAMARLRFGGELNRLLLDAATASAYRKASAHARPEVDRRRARLQGWMLERYAECGVVARVIEAADELQRLDPPLWQELVGRSLVPSTIRRNYWNRIPADEKAQAKRRFSDAAKSRKV